MKSARVFFAVLILLYPAYGQGVGAVLRGEVVDGSNAVCRGARITVVNEETNENRQVMSDNDGSFTVPTLPPGPYRVEVELSGFRKYVGRELVLQVGQTARVRLVLEAGPEAEEVLVSASQAPVDRDSAAVSTIIEGRQITLFPLDGRNFLQLSLLAAGTAPSAPGSAGSIRGEFTVNTNGAREDSNNFALDGVFNNDPKLNTFAINPPADAIREFELLTSSYDAEYGRSGGAQVNVALKSGTNALTGTAYEFLRNAATDARNFFAPGSEAPPRYQRNQFGFSVGGPIRKDRAFFFGDYEGRRVREGITRVTNAPTPEERTGDFSRSAFPKPVNPLTGVPFPGSRIPEAAQSATARAILALYPMPNRDVPRQNFISSPALRDRQDTFDVRIDHSLSRTSDLVLRYSASDRDLYEPFSGPAFSRIPGFGTTVQRRAQNLMAGESRVFSAAIVSELRVAFSRVAAGVYQEQRTGSLNRKVGLPELASNPRDSGLSFITISGFSPLGDEYNNPQYSVTNTFQVLENVSFLRGRHLAKAGVELRRVQQNAYRDIQSRGFLTFSDYAQVTGNALADLLLGYVSYSGGARLDNPQYLRNYSWSAFVQDSFRIRPGLTLLAGVRYEYNSPSVDRYDRAVVYDPASAGLVKVGTAGVPRGGYLPDRNNWAPRFGIAWSPGRSETTVVHAGYGVYYDQSSLAPGEGLYFNPPYYDFRLYFPLPGLPLTLADPFPGQYPLQLPASALGFDRGIRTGYLQHWNVKIQRQAGESRLLELAYVGSKGSRFLSARDVNQARAGAQQPNPRPQPSLADVVLLESRGNSTYHSFQATFRQRLRDRVAAIASYTLGKSLDDASNFFSSSGDPNFPQDSWNLAAEKGRSNFDLRHRLSFSSSYELPRGWTVSGIVTLQSGRPFTVSLLPEIDNSNTGRASLGFGANDRPNRIADGYAGNARPDMWFDTNAFAFPAYGRFGDSGRNILSGPGFADVSGNLVKEMRLAEGIRLQFRGEVFNLFNRANFDLPDSYVGSPTFGRILSAGVPRRFQFGLKLLF